MNKHDFNLYVLLSHYNIQQMMNSIGSSIFGRTISKKSAIGTVLRKINIKREAQQEQEKNMDQNTTNQETVSKSNSNHSSFSDKSNSLVDRHFKIRDTQENGNLSIRKLKGLKRDSEILEESLQDYVLLIFFGTIQRTS